MKTEGSSGRHQLVIQGILRHWVKYPDAKDVCDGIKWWLLEDLGNIGRERIQQALDKLVLRGWVTERRSKSAETIYGLNADKLNEIQDFMRKQK